jgi:hypothetical protein
MKTLRSQHTYIPLDKHNEHPIGASTTVPDEAFSLEEILRRSVQGLADNLMHPGEYNLEDNSEDFDAYDIEKLKQLDPYDREMLARDLKQKNEEHKAYLEKHLQEKQSQMEIEKQKQEDERIASFLERQQQKSKPAKHEAKGGTTDSE